MARPGIPKRAVSSHHRRLIRKQRPSTGKKLSGRDIMGKFAGQRTSATPEASQR